MLRPKHFFCRRIQLCRTVFPTSTEPKLMPSCDSWQPSFAMWSWQNLLQKLRL